jgi:hypothetical protein
MKLDIVGGQATGGNMKLDIMGQANWGNMKLDIVGGRATGGNMKLELDFFKITFIIKLLPIFDSLFLWQWFIFHYFWWNKGIENSCILKRLYY